MRGRSYRFLLAGVLAVVSAVYGAAPRPQPRSRIVVVKAFYAVPASERAYAASLADGTASILSRNGVRVDLVADGALDAVLAGRDLAFLVTCTKPSPAQVAALARFRGRGGVIRPLYSVAPQVASVAGAKAALPSGQALPSEADIQQTDILRKALRAVEIGLMDHVILAEDSFFSFSEEQLVKM